MVDQATEKSLESLSPFELKNSLIQLADDHSKRTAAEMINAGRGNPNWIAVEPRQAFFLLGQFAITEAQRAWQEFPGLAGMPEANGIADRFKKFVDDNTSAPGADLLRRSVDHGVTKLGFDADAWVLELTDAVTGDHYPTPDRMLSKIEDVVHEYLVQEMCGGNPPAKPYDLFATEGGTAAMCYTFDSAVTNKLLNPGDKIAIMAPIFTPYLEIPQLERYHFDVVELQASKTVVNGLHSWHYPDSEIDKLADPQVKALFCVNPSNPPSVKLPDATLDRIANVVRHRNPKLTIITDDVYGTFVPEFRSLMSVLPRNTIGVYSFSKYFGCTGWRLGVIAINEDNIFDEQLAALAAADKDELNDRYESITLEPEKLKFIDRMVADSRQVALNHTAGLSTPQQVQMALFALDGVLDTAGSYKSACLSIIARRLKALTTGLGVSLPDDPDAAHYYVELDLLNWAERHGGKGFAAWLEANHEPVDPVFRLAEQGSIVLLNGGGFDGPEWSVRVSLANLPMQAYEQIGHWIQRIYQEYVDEFNAQKA
jgi:aspartate 4-decarboxylase